MTDGIFIMNEREFTEENGIGYSTGNYKPSTWTKASYTKSSHWSDDDDAWYSKHIAPKDKAVAVVRNTTQLNAELAIPTFAEERSYLAWMLPILSDLGIDPVLAYFVYSDNERGGELQCAK